MANIRQIDLRLLDDLFEMRGGYVLDFSNRTFEDFFRDLSINIEDQKYFQGGSSKANRLRTFLRIENDTIASKTLMVLWEYRNAVRHPNDSQNEKFTQQVRQFSALLERLGGTGLPVEPEVSKTLFSRPTPDVISVLKTRLLELVAMAPQPRGYKFEKFLEELFGVYELEPRGSFRMVGEQIDGSFQLRSDVFLLEAKWQDLKVGLADLLTFAGKVEAKSQWTHGLFVSYSGFSEDGLEAFARGRRTSIICIEGLDLWDVINRSLDFREVIERKKRRAGETGLAFVSVRELFPQ
jgi:hypothetical protein